MPSLVIAACARALVRNGTGLAAMLLALSLSGCAWLDTKQRELALRVRALVPLRVLDTIGLILAGSSTEASRAAREVAQFQAGIALATALGTDTEATVRRVAALALEKMIEERTPEDAKELGKILKRRPWRMVPRTSSAADSPSCSRR